MKKISKKINRLSKDELTKIRGGRLLRKEDDPPPKEIIIIDKKIFR